MLCATCYHLDNFKNVKNTDGGVLKVTLFYGCFSRFLNCTNGTKSRKASPLKIERKYNKTLNHTIDCNRH